MIPTTSITIELFGSYGARHIESGTTIDLTNRRNRATTKSPIPVLCRELIAHGHDPQERVHIVRRSLLSDAMIPVLKRDRTLDAWAAVDCVESETRSPHVVAHRALPDSLKAMDKQPALEAGCPSRNSERLPVGTPESTNEAAE